MTRALFVGILAFGTLAACGERSSDDESKQTLLLADTVVVADTLPGLDWFGSTRGLFQSIDPKHLYVIDRHTSQIVLFSTAGQLIRIVGAAGSGPGELMSPIAVYDTRMGPMVFDKGNQKVVGYSEAGVVYLEVPLPHRHMGVTPFRDSLLVAVPGRSSLVDLYDQSGVGVDHLGARDALSELCLGCSVAELSSSVFVLLDPTVPKLFVIDYEARTVTPVDLYTALVEEWDQQARQIYRENGIPWSPKRWFGGVQPLSEHAVALLALPAHPEDGNEVWILDLNDTQIQRLSFGGLFINDAVYAANGVVFGIEAESGGVLEFHSRGN